MAASDTLGIVGTTVAEKYDVTAVVGEGGSAVVYRATHRIWKRPVALKIFKSLGEVSSGKREELLERFVQEGQLLAELSERSAAIVQARDVGTFTTAKGDWVPYMVLEWLDGATLEDVLARERNEGLALRSLDEAMLLLDPVAEGLAIAHKKGVAHRDVKPSNLFLIGDPRGPELSVKLLDFGIAKVVADAHKMAGAFSKTTGKVTSFTPAYGAPEQFSRTYGSTGPWTDVFSLALMIVELVTGKQPLDGDDFGQLAVSSAHPNERPTPRRLGAEISDDVEAVFLRALAVKPAARFLSVGDFWTTLRAAAKVDPSRGWATTTTGDVPGAVAAAVTSVALHATARPGSSSAPPPRSQPGPPARPSRVGVIAAVAVGALGIGVFAVVFGRGGEPRGAAVVAPPAASSVIGAAAGAVPPPPTCPTGMIAIPGGKFFMGSDDKADLAFERPAHKVTLAPYCIDTFEVTTEDYRMCSDEGECKRGSSTNEWDGITAKERSAFDPLCNIRDPAVKGKHPINCVDFEQATAYCAVKNKRLPTEAEWEFAARGPDGRKYPWGDEDPAPGYLNACGKECIAWGRKAGIEEKAMYDADDGWETTAPVGSFAKGASRYGVQDVVGNVWEWVADWYDDYKPDEQVDPKGPATGDERVIRGGAWNGAYAAWVRPTFRYHDAPAKKSYGVGFRCAKSL